MINAAPTPERTPQMNAVIANFETLGHTPLLKNRYDTYREECREEQKMKNKKKKKQKEKVSCTNEDGYRNEIMNSKFILCPSGIGWDTYRIWEALNLGTIPVIERYKYRYELITYPPPSEEEITLTQELPSLRPLFLDDKKKKKQRSSSILQLKAARSKELKRKHDHMKKYNSTIYEIEYYDGWHKSFEGLPIVWIDGQFSDIDKVSNSKSNSNKYLTPELLEQEYDKFARMAALNQFQYEKLTSTYWIELIESFLLTDEEIQLHTNTSWLSIPRDSKLRISSSSSSDEDDEEDENENQQHNDGNDDNDDDDVNDENNDYNHRPIPPLHQPMMIGWTILVWEIFISFKFIGIALIVIVVRRFEQQQKQQNQIQQQQQIHQQDHIHQP